MVLQLLSKLGLTDLTTHPKSGAILEATNLTILNFFLLRLGPMNEKRLVQVLMCSQVAGSVFAFFIRYGLAGLVYDGDRR
jgi:UDP-N-acetylglucosamine--dolichyl-phosphate N-acetylglucosaminephosphotransferase